MQTLAPRCTLQPTPEQEAALEATVRLFPLRGREARLLRDTLQGAGSAGLGRGQPALMLENRLEHLPLPASPRL
ncbi:hypothetical protein QT17_01935 [Thermus sp. 2.9]|uniref:Uncharacterized protein n=1 Tax=Thermus caliditerrae TaxID=1330700 RepID=A0A7C5RE08_9DEIN|nr:hypothetical protein QT17_01935 [Thermus sp. 2.9]